MFKKERLKKIISELSKKRLKEIIEIKDIHYKIGDFKRPSDVDLEKSPFIELKDNSWGDKTNRYWFRSEIKIPKHFERQVVFIKLITGREKEWDAVNPQFLFFLNDKIKQGLDMNHNEVILTDNAVAGDIFKLDFHGYAGMQGESVRFILQVGVLDILTENMKYDLEVPYEVLLLLDENSMDYINISNHLIKTINMLNLNTVGYSKEYYDSLIKGIKYLKDNLYNNSDLIEILKNKNLLETVTCVGHSHIDVAWLWTLRQTREKVVRSFATVLNLMDSYPEYKFMASQPILLQFIKEDYPELFERIKKRVKEGRFEVEGGMYLEADCNLSSGESLIRHILYGQEYMKREFDVNSKILWLPDVFGYSAALPQMLNQFGITTFVTTKISWNEYNKMPSDTFMWKGLDGSEILSYFITMMDYDNYKKGSFKTVYEGEINPSQIKGAWARYQEKDINQNILISYGHGDGGGGPTKKMLENARRMSKYIPGAPLVKLGSLGDYFDNLHNSISTSLKTWSGELYLEYHRGTLTTMGKSKWYNRKSEFLYQNLEFLSILAFTELKEKIDTNLIRKGWDTILLNQFHDIIPGTSIEEVYIESFKQYEEILENGFNYQKELITKLSKNILLEEKINTSVLIVFNPLSVKGNQIIKFKNNKEVLLYDEKYEYKVQTHENTSTFIGRNIPSKGYKVFFVKEKIKLKEKLDKIKSFTTDYYEIEFDDRGFINRLYDIENSREVVLQNEVLNQFIIYEDRPHNWDAWDVNIYYEEKPVLIDNLSFFEIVEDGLVYTKIKTVRKFQSSTIIQYIIFYKKSRRIDFETEVDWNEKHLLLKVLFPVDVFSNTATFDHQFGNIERPTHRNTSWDEAKFQVCGHKWADISERGYGVSLLSDSKYAYDVFENVISLSLLRSSEYPNPNADIGIHNFKYALLPHTGSLDKTTFEEGYNFNVDMITYLNRSKNEFEISKIEKSFCNVEASNIIIDTIKKSENNRGIIIRIYENLNKRTRTKINFDNKYKIYEVNLKEEILNKAENIENSILIEMKPFEIKTFILLDLGDVSCN